MKGLSPRGWLLAVLAIVFTAHAIPVGIHKGIDAEIHINAAQLLLERQPLYADAPGIGVWWPPFAIAALTPFALLARWSMPFAKGLYSLCSVVCLVWAIARFGRAGRPYLATAIAAVAVPLQTNFDYLNLNAVLLALVAAAGFDLAARRDTRAGVWLGIAAALKAFPALLLLYAAYRRRWRAAAWGGGLALALSVCSLLPLGLTEAVTSARHWLASSAAGVWVVHPRNQSLPALLTRAGVPPSGVIAIDLALLILAGVALRRTPPDDDLVSELGIMTLLMVLLSPLAWEHYYLLALPAWVAALSRPQDQHTPGFSIGLFVIALATSGVLTVWSGSFREVLLDHSSYAWGALGLALVLLGERLVAATRPIPIPDAVAP